MPKSNLRADGAQLVGRLLEQLLHVRQDQHAAIPLADGVFADRRHDRRLAAGRGDHDARIVVPRPQVLVDGAFVVVLVRSQREHLHAAFESARWSCRRRPARLSRSLSRTIWLSSHIRAAMLQRIEQRLFARCRYRAGGGRADGCSTVDDERALPAAERRRAARIAQTAWRNARPPRLMSVRAPTRRQ